MPVQSVAIDEKAKTVTVVMDLDKPKASASGKTMVIASSRGNQVTDAEFKGQPVVVGMNVYFKP